MNQEKEIQEIDALAAKIIDSIIEKMRELRLQDKKTDTQYTLIGGLIHYVATLEHRLRKVEGERFIRPTDKQVVEAAILFNNGKLQKRKLADMVALVDFVIDRLYENGDVSKPSSKEQ